MVAYSYHSKVVEKTSKMNRFFETEFLKHPEDLSFLVFIPSSRDLCFRDTMLNMPLVAVDKEAATKNVCHGDDCGRIGGSQQLLHKHISGKYRFSFRKVQISLRYVLFRKVQ